MLLPPREESTDLTMTSQIKSMTFMNLHNLTSIDREMDTITMEVNKLDIAKVVTGDGQSRVLQL